MRKILAVSSGGGHWEEMMILRDSFADARVIYVNTYEGLAENSGVGPAYVVRDCNRHTPRANLRCASELWRILRTERPDVIVSTGAAPGLIAVILGKLIGAKTIWVDSVANSEQLSMSGRIAGKFADLWLTQWRHLETSPSGPRFWGSVL